MSSPSTLDFSLLLKPIFSEAPAGIDIRKGENSDLYHTAKDARFLARTIERKNPGEESKAKEKWENVYTICLEILESQSKDIEILTWLIESLVRKFGFAGLRDGLHLVNEYIKVFWDELYPQPDEDGISSKIRGFINLNGEDGNGTLVAPIMRIPLTQGHTNGPFALWQYKQALETEKINDPEKREKYIAEGRLSLKDFDTAVKETSVNFFKDLMEDMDLTLSELTLFDSLMIEKCAKEAPSIGALRRVIGEIFSAVKFFAKDVMKTGVLEVDSIKEKKKEASTGIIKEEDILSRDNAFQILLNVASFFKKTEPQSPLPYILERTVRWGGLTLPELMSELIEDENARSRFFYLTGVEQKD